MANKYKMVTQDGKTKKVRVGKSQAEKDSEKIYNEIKGKNKRHETGSSETTREFNGIEFPVDVFQFITNIFADKRKENEGNREIAQSLIDNIIEDPGHTDYYIDEIRDWMKNEKPGFTDNSRYSSHIAEDFDEDKVKELVDALNRPELDLFTNVPEAPNVTGTEGKVKEFKESDKDKSIREDFEKEHKDDVSKAKQADTKLRDFVDTCIEEYNFLQSELDKTNDPEQRVQLQEQLLLVQADLNQGFKALGLTGKGAKEGNSGNRLKDLLQLYNKEQNKADENYANAVNEEVHYGSADPDNSQYENAVDAYKQAQLARKQAVEERAENKEALKQAKKKYTEDRDTSARDLGESDMVGFMTDPAWAGLFAAQSKSPVAKRQIIKDWGGEEGLKNKRNEYYTQFANDRYNEMKDAGTLQKYIDHFAPDPITNELPSEDKLKRYIMRDLMSEEDRVGKNKGRLIAEYMRDKKAGKTPRLAWGDIDKEANWRGSPEGYEDALYSTLPNWKKHLKSLLDEEQENRDPETLNTIKNRDLFDKLVQSVIDDDTVTLSPEEFKVVEWMEDNGQDVLDNPDNYSYRTRFLVNEWFNSLDKMSAQQNYDKSKQDVRDQEAIMQKNRAGYDDWKDFASRTNINDLVKRLDALKASIEKHNKNDEIHSADFHQMQMSDDEKKQIRELQAQIARLSMGKDRKVNVSELGDDSYMATATGEGAAFRFIMKPEPDDPNKFKVYQARPRLTYEDMEKVRRDPDLTDAQKNDQMYVIDGPAIGFVGSDDDLTFTLDTDLNEDNSEYTTSEIRRRAAEQFAKKLGEYGLGRSPDSVLERRQYKENRKQVAQANLNEVRDRLLNLQGGGFDNLVKVAKLGSLNPNNQESALYNIFSKTGIYYDPIKEQVYGSLDDAKAAGADISKLLGPDESLGDNSYEARIAERRALGKQAMAAKIKNNAGSFVDENGNSVLTVSPDQISSSQGKFGSVLTNEKTGHKTYKKINRGELDMTAQTDVHRLKQLEDMGIEPDKLVEEGSNYKDKVLEQINDLEDVSDRDNMLEFVNDLTGKYGKNLLSQIRRNTQKVVQGTKEYHKNDPYYKNPGRKRNLARLKQGKPEIKKETIEPGADGNYNASGDWFTLFGGSKLK